MHVPIRRLLLVLFALTGIVGLVATGCGGDDDADTSEGTTASTFADDADPGESGGDPDMDDVENPVLLGVQVSGPEGATLEIEATAYADGEAQQPMDLVATVRDDPWYFLFSTFIDSAELSVGGGTGGAVTIETVRGRAANPEDPTAGIEVIEVLDTTEVTEGGTATFELP